MIYFATGNDPALIQRLTERPDFGVMATPNSGNSIAAYPSTAPLALDNGCFSSTAKWSATKWERWLTAVSRRWRDRVVFAAVPDVLCDHESTLALWNEFARTVSDCGVPTAFVLQNGCDSITQVPVEADALFVGGDDGYKESPAVAAILRERGDRWAHMGRVNSFRRMRVASGFQCDSTDGTFISFAPRANVPKVASWLNRVNEPRLPLDLEAS